MLQNLRISLFTAANVAELFNDVGDIFQNVGFRYWQSDLQLIHKESTQKITDLILYLPQAGTVDRIQRTE